MFTLQFLNVKIDQITNFAKIAKGQIFFFGISVNSSVQISKSKHLVCQKLFWDIRAKIYLSMEKMLALNNQS